MGDGFERAYRSDTLLSVARFEKSLNKAEPEVSYP